MHTIHTLLAGLAIGAAATATLDMWNLLLARVWGVRSLDYCLLGRWIAHMRRGVVRHANINTAARVRFECVAGWVAHYGIGAWLAAVLMGAAPSFIDQPTLGPAVTFGIGTVVLPFFVLQPALGLGVAASATQSPARARLKSLATHTVYGLGLYGWALVFVWLRG